MSCKKPNPWIILLINTFLTAAAFMIIDFIWYGLLSPGPDPYSKMLGEKIGYTFLLALPFAHLYNKASRMWRPQSNESFVYKGHAGPDPCKATWPKIANGLYFSMLLSLVVIVVMVMGSLFLITLYQDILLGIRGDFAVDSPDAGVLAFKFITTSVVLELGGKTEDDPDR